MAAVYVSSWFWDLYCAIQRSVEKISSTAYTSYFHTPQAFMSTKYDAFLCRLNAVIRPTHIQLGLEDTLWIPKLVDRYAWNTDNPFNIPGFTINEAFFRGIIELMEAPNTRYKVEEISSTTLGRPMWLLDWHGDRAYAWFPTEFNCIKEDIVAAQILGVPCTPNLGPCDVDDWQYFPGGTMPADIPENLTRITPRRFYGSAEFRSVETDWQEDPFQGFAAPTSAGVKRSATETMLVLPRLARYRIIDWCYHARVVLEECCLSNVCSF
ncbi:hypothetical protein L6164_022413 [Bauhinia variegata]|uniref:Uncharacterized protein n=1 Tax=Bauhinia variegata TaxID=167791 RepID=A0ACB9MF32_BAUVA|nr:hypothetical protein L6164_022413 [Bauhinia variegata]